MATTGPGTEQLEALGPELDAAVRAALELVPRIWDRDHTVWQEDATEVADRLGWLDAPDEFAERSEDLARFADGVVDEGFEHVVLVGMGGSSLYPDVLSRTLGAGVGHPRLTVLDSTDPGAVLRIHRKLPWDRTLLVAASKSGTTTETRSHLAYFWDVLTDLRGVEAGRQVAAVTDPGSELAELGHARSFRAVFRNRQDIGGRFSALTYFGLVPAALLGIDVAAHLRPAQQMAEAARTTDDANGPARLGAVLAAAHAAGRNKLTLVLGAELGPFGDWIEQLVAESTGKHGVGILPVLERTVGPDTAYGDDRLFVTYDDVADLSGLAAAGHPVVSLPAVDAAGIGAEAFRWEFATAVAGALLGINPFDQPDVAAAKAATTRVLDEGLPDLATDDVEPLLAQIEAGDYVAILAFVDPGTDVVEDLHRTAERLRDRLSVPVTVGVGPRYLHSTGQLHKGGPPLGVFLVVVGDDPEDAAIPREPHGFSTLKRAQAAGDLEALRARGARAGLVPLERLRALGR